MGRPKKKAAGNGKNAGAGNGKRQKGSVSLKRKAHGLQLDNDILA